MSNEAENLNPESQGQGDPAQEGAVSQDQAGEHVDALKSRIAELEDAFLRTKADMENQRRRAQEDIVKAHKFSVEKFARELLAVKDSLEMALLDNSSIENLKAGVDLTLKQLNAAFEKSQIAEINPVGQKLDPHQHQAISTVESEQEANTVVQVMQKGYLLADRVIRPAMVVVAKGKS